MPIAGDEKARDDAGYGISDPMPGIDRCSLSHTDRVLGLAAAALVYGVLAFVSAGMRIGSFWDVFRGRLKSAAEPGIPLR